MDKTIVYGKAAEERTVWIQVEITLSEKLQLQAFQDEQLVRDKSHTGWKWYGDLNLASMTEVKIAAITVEKLTIEQWTAWALDGWLDHRPCGRCTGCRQQGMPVWTAVRADPNDHQPEDYCQNCWLKEMLKFGKGSKKDEKMTLDKKPSKKRAVEETGLEPSMRHLSLQTRGPDIDEKKLSCEIIEVCEHSGLGTVGEACTTGNAAD